MSPSSLRTAVAVSFLCGSTFAFNSALFQKAPAQQQTFPSKTDGVEIELPAFDELFGRIQQVSPLTRVAIEQQHARGTSEKRGFEAVESEWSKDLKWKKVEANPRRTVHQIEKIDNFNGFKPPIVRFRASLEGPCVGECFANMIMDTAERKRWDVQIDRVYEAYPIHDKDAVNIAMGFRYGDCSRVGVGHCLTKSNLGVDAREQLTICGINDFADGSCLIWGTEMEDWHDHLFPPGQRRTRGRSHLFSTVMVPTGPNTFDVEYVLQLDIGGNIPTWMTTPLVVDSVKKLMEHAKGFYLNKDGRLAEFLEEKAKRNIRDGYSLLTPP